MISMRETKQLETEQVMAHANETCFQDTVTSGCALEMRFSLRNVNCNLPD